MDPSLYITPEEYEIAEKNGIPRKNLNRRVRFLYWDKQRAITEPLQKSGHRKKYADIAKKNGISYDNFIQRVNKSGWTEEEAATIPVMTLKEVTINATKHIKRVINPEIKELAERNGINYQTLYSRIKKKGMDPVEAATKPPLTKSEVGKIRKSISRPVIYGNKLKKSV